MARILPGVEIQVVKEIVPQQLHPSGIVGVIGTAEKGPMLIPTPVTSYSEFKDIFGSDATQSLAKEVRNCFLNGVFQVFATRIEATGSKDASVTLKDEDGATVVKLESKSQEKPATKLRWGLPKGALKEVLQSR